MEGGKKAALSITLVMATAVLALTLVLGGCGGGVSGTVTASGSTTVQPLAQVAAEQFMEENSGVTVNIQGGGSSTGITQVSEGSVDIGNSSRDLKPEEESLGLVDNKIAYDIIAMIVNPDLTVSNLTTDQAKGIFVGTIKNWSEVGGADDGDSGGDPRRGFRHPGDVRREGAGLQEGRTGQARIPARRKPEAAA